MDNKLNAGVLEFCINDTATKFRWRSEGLTLCEKENGDFWRVHMDDGEYREITIRSSNQTGRVIVLKNAMDIIYDNIVSNDGRKFDCKLTIHIKVVNSTYESFEMSAEIENNDKARLNEIQLPFMDFSMLCNSQRSKDVLYKMNGLGEKIENPWENLKYLHTEYISSDYNQIWDFTTYPNRASMCWFGVQSNKHFLYIGKHDANIRTTVLSTGVSPRNSEPELILSISHFPLVKQNEKLKISSCIVALNEGDWRKGSDIYGNFARDNWYTVPKKPRWVQDLTGWQRIILKHQYGEIFFKYKDLPRIYEESKKYGLDMLMVFGWWKGRFDNGYPVYEPDPALGGEAELKSAINRIHDLGGRVALYTNGVLIDVATDYYEQTGKHICRKDIDNNEYREHYKFSNDGMTLRCFGYKSFVSACQATDEWKDRLIYNGKVKLSFDPDSIFYDQIGGHSPSLCFDETHFHGARGDSETYWRIENLKSIYELCGNEKAFGTEFTVDAYVPYVHYHHGCMCGNVFTKTAFPDLFLRTFPEPIQSNRFLHDNRYDYKRVLNYAFIYGFRFDVSIFRGRKITMGELPDYAEYIKKLIDLKAKYHEYFYYGKFVVNTEFDLPDHLKIKEYISGDKTLFAIWNDSDSEQKFVLEGNEITMASQEVGCYIKGSGSNV